MLMSFVVITLDHGEDEQQIFDTINSLGVKLTTGELLKNYLFSQTGLSDYEEIWKLVPDPHAIADLMLYYVEQGCSLTAQFGDYEEPFYTALENNFNKAIKFVVQNCLLPEFAPRMKKMIESVECCGYGFPDTLWDMYYEYADESL